MMFRVILFFLSCVLLSVGHGQVSDADLEVLVDFYHASGGDDWYRNDGWLDEDTAVCDWYGVECWFRDDLDRDLLHQIELPANNLSGTLDTHIFEVVHRVLDLSDNQIGGTLDKLPQSPGRIDLSNNALSGILPTDFSRLASDLSTTAMPSSTWFLDLSSNDFEGEVPTNWTGTLWLSLANNRLEGLPLSLFEQDWNSQHFLDLSDNHFSGSLPSWIMERLFVSHDDASRWGGGLNLCWNDFEIDNPELVEWIGERHVGGANFEQCMAGERLETGPELSGSWFDPARDGEGVSMHLLDNDQALLFWFTFDDEGGQRWLFEVGEVHDRALDWKPLMQTRGHFGQGFATDDDESPMDVRGSFRLDRVGEQSLMAERVYIDPTRHDCFAIYPPPLSCFGSSLSDRLDYQRLTELAGTTCGNQTDMQQYSGAWYNPERSGEGFVVEVLPNDRAVVYWFTYTPDGSGAQAWMIGVDQITEFHPDIIADPPPPNPIEAHIQIESMNQPQGGIYGPDFDPGAIEHVDWGSLEIRFNQDGDGHVTWDSHLEEYGTGNYPIERLARPMLAECELEG